MRKTFSKWMINYTGRLKFSGDRSEHNVGGLFKKGNLKLLGIRF